MSTLAFRPSRTEIASTETVPLTFEMADMLASGESVASPTTSLTNLITGASYSSGLSGSPAVSDTRILQSVTALVAGQRYRLVVTMTPSAGKTLSSELIIEVPF